MKKLLMLADRRVVNEVKGGQIDESISGYDQVYLPEMIKDINKGKQHQVSDKQIIEKLGAEDLLDVGDEESPFAHLRDPKTRERKHPDKTDKRIAKEERMRQLRALYHAIYTAGGNDTPIAVAGLDPEVMNHMEKLSETDPAVKHRLDNYVEMVGHGFDHEHIPYSQRNDVHKLVVKDGLLSKNEGQAKKPDITSLKSMARNGAVRDLQQMSGPDYEKSRQTVVQTVLTQRMRNIGMTEHDKEKGFSKNVIKFMGDNESLATPVLSGQTHPLDAYQTTLDKHDKKKQFRPLVSKEEHSQTEQKFREQAEETRLKNVEVNDKHFKQQELKQQRREIKRFNKQQQREINEFADDFTQEDVWKARENRRGRGGPPPPPPEERTVEEMNEEMRKLGIENKPWNDEMDF